MHDLALKVSQSSTDRCSQTTISDLVQIPPHEFYKLSRDEVEDKINEKYSNKVTSYSGASIPGSAF
jgi:hypothetical protein